MSVSVVYHDCDKFYCNSPPAVAPVIQLRINKLIQLRKLKEMIVIGNIIVNVTSSFSKAISYECYVTCADFRN